MAAEIKSLSLQELVLKLFDVKGLKFGRFVMRTGEVTPIYIDMRVIWTYPELVVSVCEHIWDLFERKNISCDLLCGLPYQGIPIASYLSTKYNVPMLLKRKRPKDYGTKQFFEGHYRADQKVVIVDDVLMTGGTIVEDIPVFRDEGLSVEASVIFFDRQQGGMERIKHIHGVDTHCVLSLSDALQFLLEAGKISQETVDATHQYLSTNRFDTAKYGVELGTGNEELIKQVNNCA
ncbi:hypothetical protein CAPTEDRAFT_174437 [Capitella teleta]|uniref:orotate phosphoribosyltransferase n=1 Tax=Capitella teleta TaxID=283909 RepID=R7THK3_CAPTE|nr:hypothetical protein CAPTEDRAFT_174437 [Capitella teleta]|eukprot:ELT91051.1 hypothetical protein CAPTEDRAFT_174437 [Capitella teleta]